MLHAKLNANQKETLQNKLFKFDYDFMILIFELKADVQMSMK